MDTNIAALLAAPRDSLLSELAFEAATMAGRAAAESSGGDPKAIAEAVVQAWLHAARLLSEAAG